MFLVVHCFQVELKFGMLVFAEGGTLDEPDEPDEPDELENKQQTQPTCDASHMTRHYAISAALLS